MMRLTRFASYDAREAEHDVLLSGREPAAVDCDGLTLLVGLCNLFRAIPADDPDTAIDLMLDWCAANAHPYREPTFGAMELMRDLNRLFATTAETLTLAMLTVGDAQRAEAAWSGCFDQGGENLCELWQQPEQRARLLAECCERFPKRMLSTQGLRLRPNEPTDAPATGFALAYAALAQLAADPSPIAVCAHCGDLFAADADSQPLCVDCRHAAP